MPVLVLDINGVLADVRKRRERRPWGRQPDLVLHNGQPVYLRPGVAAFLAAVSRLRAQSVLWTSRRAENARPIEELLSVVAPEWRPTNCLHGEDCRYTRNFKPQKDSRTLRETCHVANGALIGSAGQGRIASATRADYADAAAGAARRTSTAAAACTSKTSTCARRSARAVSAAS